MSLLSHGCRRREVVGLNPRYTCQMIHGAAAINEFGVYTLTSKVERLDRRHIGAVSLAG